MGWQRTAALMFLATLAAEASIMIGLGSSLFPALEGRLVAMTDAAMIAVASFGSYALIRWLALGRRPLSSGDWLNAALVLLLSAAFELSLHMLSHHFVIGLNEFSVEFVDAVSMAIIVGIVSGWLALMDQQVAAAAAGTARGSPMVIAGTVFAMLILSSLPVIEILDRQLVRDRASAAAPLLNTLENQRALSQRVGRLALLQGSDAQSDFMQTVLSAEAYGVRTNQLAQDYAARNHFSFTDYPHLPGNAALDHARGQHLALARRWLAAPPRERRILAAQLQQSIDALQPLLLRAIVTVNAIETRRASQQADPTGGWLGNLLIVLLAVSLAGPPLRLVQAQRLRLVEALADLSAYQRALNEQAIVAMTDPRGVITYVNDHFCMVSGYKREELLGQRHDILNSGYHDPSFFAAMWRTISQGQIWRAEVCNRRKDGELYWVDTSIVPLRGDQSQPTGFVTIRYDVTERRAAQDELKHTVAELEKERELLEARVKERTIEIQTALTLAKVANEAKSHFLTTITHELRTPLHTIVGYAELVRDDLSADGNEQATSDLNMIIDAARHQLTLIGEVLDFSKIEARQVQLEVLDVNLEMFLAEVASSAQILAVKSGCELRSEVDSALGVCQSDATKLRQCLLNLLSNAAKFTQRGRITLRAYAERRSSEDGVCIEVRDTGIGMSPETLAVIFEPFKQADESFARKYGGTGLGLPITKQLIELLGGKLSVASQPDEGSTFTIWLPRTYRCVGTMSQEEEAA